METSKLILTVKDSQDRAKWLAVREQGIGGSDAGAILGMNPYRSAMDVWLEKRGEKQLEDLSGKEAVKAGILLEPVVAKWFEDETGKKVTRRGTLQSIAHPFMLANVDRMVVGEDAGLEIKTAGGWAAKQWVDDEIPDSYYCQCLHYMAVTGCAAWYIAALIGGQKFIWKKIDRNEEDIQALIEALIGGQKFIWKKIDRNEEDIQALIEAEETFWKHVEDGTPPAIDASASCGEALAYHYRDAVPGSTLDLNTAYGRGADAEAAIQALHEVAQEEKALKDKAQKAKNTLMDIMGESETGYFTFPDGGRCKITWKAPKPSETVKLSDIRKKAPDVYMVMKKAGLITLRKATRSFRVYRND